MLATTAAVTALTGGVGAERAMASAAPRALAPTAGLVAASEAAARPRRATLTVRRTRYGPILADGRGRILYEFTRDGTRRRSRCYGACAVAWPPFFTSGRPRVRGAARADLVGTTRRRGGWRQVTYAGKPLYFYIADRAPGEVTCQDVREFGGTWFVTNPDGSTNRSPR